MGSEMCIRDSSSNPPAPARARFSGIRSAAPRYLAVLSLGQYCNKANTLLSLALMVRAERAGHELDAHVAKV